MTKVKVKETVLKAARGKQQVTYKGNKKKATSHIQGKPIRLSADFSAATLLAERGSRIYLKY